MTFLEWVFLVLAFGVLGLVATGLIFLMGEISWMKGKHK